MEIKAQLEMLSQPETWLPLRQVTHIRNLLELKAKDPCAPSGECWDTVEKFYKKHGYAPRYKFKTKQVNSVEQQVNFIPKEI